MGYDRNKVVQVALAEEGYLEKKSNSKLDSKTANAGSNNYTKYGKEMGCNGDYWCDAFVDWCFVQAYGRDNAKNILGGFSNYTPTSASYLPGISMKESLPGDIIFFKNSSRICHTGIIEKVSGGKVYTIEGNTSGASGVVANGGGVARKSYSTSYSKIAKVCRPNFGGSSSSSESTSASPGTTSKPSGYYLHNSRVGVWQNAMNVGFDTKTLTVDNKFGPKSQAFAKTHILWRNQKHNCPTAIKWLQRILREVYGFSKLSVTGKWSAYLDTCIKVFQKNRGLTQDAQVGLQTTYWLLSGIVK